MKKQFIRIASVLFPDWVLSMAYRQLTNPQVRKLREHELLILEKAQKETFDFKDYTIQLYTWKGGEKTVLLIHGWEGQAGNFSDLIQSLVADGYSVYSFDAPSHGFSSSGDTSLFEFSELVAVLIKKFQAKNLVSHSFGGVATTYALYQNRDLFIDKYVLLTSPDKFIERINDVAETVGITEKIKNRLIEKLEMDTGGDVENLNVSDFVKKVRVKKSLIIHDVDDQVIPISRSKNVHSNWEECEFLEVRGTGHFRILRTKQVIDSVIAFLNQENG
ncbi:alpha/beta fold hydrolase [Algoriphagus namhaensis]